MGLLSAKIIDDDVFIARFYFRNLLNSAYKYERLKLLLVDDFTDKLYNVDRYNTYNDYTDKENVRKISELTMYYYKAREHFLEELKLVFDLDYIL